ncbi:hypothetical protein VCHENC02_2907, partial [Vibrio harveyi]
MSEDEKRHLGLRARGHVMKHYSLTATSKKWLDLYKN